MTTQQWWRVTLPTGHLARAWGSRLRQSNIKHIVRNASEMHVATDSSHSEKFLADNRAKFRLSWTKAQKPATELTSRCGIAFSASRAGRAHENRCNACRRLRSNDAARSTPPGFVQVERSRIPPARALINRVAKSGNEANQRQPVAQVHGATAVMDDLVDDPPVTPLDGLIEGMEADSTRAMELATQLDDIVTALRQIDIVRQQLAELEAAATKHRGILAELMREQKST